MVEKPVNENDMKKKIKVIADDFLFARDNSLGKGKVQIIEAKPGRFE